MRSELTPDPEYHRRRAEAEMERALQALRPDQALLHLELARFHRERRELLALVRTEGDRGRARPITGTDKEC